MEIDYNTGKIVDVIDELGFQQIAQCIECLGISPWAFADYTMTQQVATKVVGLRIMVLYSAELQ